MRDNDTPPPRPIIDAILDLVLDAPNMLGKGHNRESIRQWLYARVDVASPLPEPTTHTLPPGIKRRLYVDRKRAAIGKPPIVVEEETPGNGTTKWFARNVKGFGWPSRGPDVEFEFKWTERDDIAPALWIETDNDLELTL